MSEFHKHIKGFLRAVKPSCSPATYNAYRERLSVFEKFAGERKPFVTLFEEYKNFLIESGRSRRTVRLYYATLRYVYTWAVNTQRIGSNPVPPLMHFTVPISERQGFSKEDLDKVLAVMSEKWKLITLLAYHTGQRLGDLACLTWDSVDLVNCEIHLMPRKTERFGKRISVPIPVFLSARLSEWKMQYPEQADGLAVFPSFCRSYQKFQHRWLSNCFIDFCKRAGLTRSFHCLRHSFVSRLANNGTPPIVIASMTGHSLKQIMSYAHVEMDTKRKALYDESGSDHAETAPGAVLALEEQNLQRQGGGNVLPAHSEQHPVGP